MKKNITLITLLFILVTFAQVYTSPDRRFMRLADEYFDTFYFPDNPTLATSMGIHLYDDQLEDYSQEAVKSRISTLRNYESRVEGVNSEALSEMVRGDHALLLNSIRSQLLSLETIRIWEKNPDYRLTRSLRCVKMNDAKPNEMGAIAGDLCDVESMFALKELMQLLDVHHIDCRQDAAFIPLETRAQYLFNQLIN